MSAAATRGLPDASARARAVTEFGTNLVVLAGAGTGKTSLLVERVLNAIGSGHVEIDQIGAITFTERAASEMRQRLADGLEELRRIARDESPGGSETPAQRSVRWLFGDRSVDAADLESRALRALEGLDQAKVQTIHGFCSELLRSHPIEAGVDPRFSVDPGDQARARFEPMWEEFLTDELGPDASRPEIWNALLERMSPGAIGDVARQLASFRFAPSLLSDPESSPTADELVGDELSSVATELADLLSRARGLSNHDERFFAGITEAFGAWSAGGLEPFRARLCKDPWLEKKITTSKATTKDKVEGVTPDEVAAVYKRCRDIARLVLPVDTATMVRLVEAVAPFALRLRESLVRVGWIGFDALLALARDLLRDHVGVRRALKRRYRMLLVDEFQDVDPLQYEIVMFLAEVEDVAAFDAWSAVLSPGRLFVVGDPKQSIYRFRGADYSAFRVAVDRITAQGGARLDLVANFRSVDAVVGPVNSLFDEDSTVWRASDYQPEYEPIRPVRKADSDAPRVEVWTVDAGSRVRAGERREIEGRMVAREIEKLHRSESVPYRRIAVLFRTFLSIPAYLRPLRERGIPFVVDGGKDFLKRPEISQTLAVLRTIAQPSDPVALLAYLRSPAGGLSDDELARWAAERGRWSWRERPDPERHARLSQVFEFLRGLHRDTRQLPADAVVGRALEATALLDLAAAAYEGSQRVANLRKLAATAAELGRDGRLSLEQVVDALQEGGLADLESDSPLADDAADAVRITSIHKMKGLESDWVLLPDLARQDIPGGPRRSVVVETARANDGRPALAIRHGKLANAGWLRYESEKQRHELAEEVRVLYVAATRARDRLVLIGAPTRSPGLGLRLLQRWKYDPSQPPEDGATLCGGTVLHRLQRRSDLRAVVAENEVERTRGPVVAWEEATQRLRDGSGAPFAPPSASEDEPDGLARGDGPETAPRVLRRSRAAGRAVGVVVHRALETWDGVNDTLLRVGARLCREIAADEEVDADRLETDSGEVLRSFLGSELADRFRTAEKLGREVPMLLRRESDTLRAWRGSIDLIYRDRDGATVVADYKTDQDDDPADLAARYGAQLAIYAEAVRRALGLDAAPRRELWLLRSGKRVELGGASHGSVTKR